MVCSDYTAWVSLWSLEIHIHQLWMKTSLKRCHTMLCAVYGTDLSAVAEWRALWCPAQCGGAAGTSVLNIPLGHRRSGRQHRLIKRLVHTQQNATYEGNRHTHITDTNQYWIFVRLLPISIFGSLKTAWSQCFCKPRKLCISIFFSMKILSL